MPGGAPKGNTNAAMGKQWSDAVRKVVIQSKKLDTLAKKLVDMALDGDLQAIKEIGNRLDGRAPQAIQADVITPTVIKQVRNK